MGQAAGGTAGEDQTDLRPGLRGEGGQGKQEQQYEQQAAHENDPEPGEKAAIIGATVSLSRRHAHRQARNRHHLLHPVPVAAACRLAGPELLSTFADDLGKVCLEPGTGGVFRITCDGVQVWERKADGGFPEAKALKQRVRDRIDPQRDLGHNDRPSR